MRQRMTDSIHLPKWVSTHSFRYLPARRRSSFPVSGNISLMNNRPLSVFYIYQSSHTSVCFHCSRHMKNYKCWLIRKKQPNICSPDFRLFRSALSLFVFWIFTDYSDTTFSLDDLALFANRFNRWSNLHCKVLLSSYPFRRQTPPKSCLHIIPETCGKCKQNL